MGWDSPLESLTLKNDIQRGKCLVSLKLAGILCTILTFPYKLIFTLLHIVTFLQLTKELGLPVLEQALMPDMKYTSHQSIIGKQSDTKN